MATTRDFPALPRGLRDVAELGTWLGKLKTWAADVLARLAALDQAPVQQVSADATLDPTWDFIEYVGPGGHTLTLPRAQRAGVRRSRPLRIINNGAGAITLAAQGGETINGQATQSLWGASVNQAKAIVDLTSNGADTWVTTGTLMGALKIVSKSIAGSGFTVPFQLIIDGDEVMRVEYKPGTPPAFMYLKLFRELVVGGTLTIQGTAISVTNAAGCQIGQTNTQKLGKWGSTPVVQPVLATGAGHTVDDVITMLQGNGDCRQS